MPRSAAPTVPMTLGNMREQGVRSLSVSCWQCHHAGVLSVDPFGCRLRAVLRRAHGMHAVRNRRHRCTAELAGAGEPDGGALALKSSISRLRLAAHKLPGSEPNEVCNQCYNKKNNHRQVRPGAAKFHA